jgi:hypothetical protein
MHTGEPGMIKRLATLIFPDIAVLRQAKNSRFSQRWSLA